MEFWQWLILAIELTPIAYGEATDCYLRKIWADEFDTLDTIAANCYCIPQMDTP